MPFVECHVATGLSQPQKTKLISGYREGHSSIDRFGSEDHQPDSGRASRSKHEHFGAHLR